MKTDTELKFRKTNSVPLTRITVFLELLVQVRKVKGLLHGMFSNQKGILEEAEVIASSNFQLPKHQPSKFKKRLNKLVLSTAQALVMIPLHNRITQMAS